MCDAHLANKYAEAYLNLRAKETGIMGLNDTPNAERVYIGIFGNRNAGKSSLINAITNQTTAVVSDVPGTTTDPVSKTMELLPLGPVVLVDTPGYDDEGLLGAVIGGIAGVTIAPSIMKAVCKILGIDVKGQFGSLITSRLVLAALCTEMGWKK